MEIKDLICYNHAVREAYLEAMARLPWNDVTAPRGLSFDSMRHVFVHLSLVEDRWINYIIPDRFNEWVDPEFDSFNNMDVLKKYIQRIQADTEKYLTKLTEQELNRLIVVPWGERPYQKLQVESVLTHMIMEDMVHYGELSAAFWQMGLEAPYRAFWRYKAQQNHRSISQL
jgi:uncharacterized damage-inducible protein DinB